MRECTGGAANVAVNTVAGLEWVTVRIDGVSLSVRGTAMYQRSRDTCCKLQAF
jgi:hypothetical protein